MNIFILDEDPVIAAQMHCDQHLQKMILESAQMLSTALHHTLFNQANKFPASYKSFIEAESKDIYKPAYQGHPCTIWCHESYANFMWVVDLVYSLQAQLPKLHKAYHVVKQCEKLARKYKLLFPSIHRTPFALAMPDEIKYNDTKFPDAVSKYHEWYKYKALEWRINGRFMSYTQYGQRPIPEWLRSTINKVERTEFLATEHKRIQEG